MTGGGLVPSPACSELGSMQQSWELLKPNVWVPDDDGRQKIIPHQFRIMNNKRVIYLRENLLITVIGNNPLHEQEQSLAARSANQKQESRCPLY